MNAVLVANRGEIAIRIARTLRDLGLGALGVFTEADARALHVERLDAAARVPSYLDAAAVVAAAQRLGADAVHPGYGFLSESPAFAQAVLDAGLTWIGPPPAAIAAMGDKAEAKRLAVAAGLPVVPGFTDAAIDAGKVRRFGEEHGYPVLVKAVAGGGGRGMRVVAAPEAAGEAIAAAAREAGAAFGDDRLMLERYLERPRHVEVQVLADRHGGCVALGERECSLQRRHQKVVEEAPAPGLDPEVRAALHAAAVALALACAYEGAGTVEFLVTGTGFFFLEMNTRLQVEHPVTELVHGVDLVALQVAIADGALLPPGLADRAASGHAVEARLYAEDPAAGFLPAAGTVLAWAEPGGAGVRVDAGVATGSEVGTAYDPMLAKVIAHGPDRATALARLDRALAGTCVLGLPTSAGFTRALLALPEVRDGTLDTGLLERALLTLDLGPPADLLPAAASIARARDTAGQTTAPGPWRRRLEGHGEVRADAASVTAAGATHAATARLTGSGAVVELDGVARAYAVAADGDALWVGRDGHALHARPEVPGRTAAATGGGRLEAPMPGIVLQVRVGNGDVVEEGDVLVVLESMKMELAIAAPHAGTVEALEVAEGDRVERRQALATVTPA
jgi:acetyl-CoA/propionyl-CoA carboxylase biotin carboxyl carrier protein